MIREIKQFYDKLKPGNVKRELKICEDISSAIKKTLGDFSEKALNRPFCREDGEYIVNMDQMFTYTNSRIRALTRKSRLLNKLGI